MKLAKSINKKTYAFFFLYLEQNTYINADENFVEQNVTTFEANVQSNLKGGEMEKASNFSPNHASQGFRGGSGGDSREATNIQKS